MILIRWQADPIRTRRDLSSGAIPSYPGTVDLVKILNLKSTPPGVEKATGICERRPESDGPDAAFKITDRAVASIPTAQVFPGKLIYPALLSDDISEVFFYEVSSLSAVIKVMRFPCQKKLG